MRETTISISCVYAECGRSAAELLQESFQFFLKKELISLAILPPV